jgi:hypothetical protein
MGASVGWRPGGESIFLGLHAGGVVEFDAEALDGVGSRCGSTVRS